MDTIVSGGLRERLCGLIVYSYTMVGCNTRPGLGW